MLKKKSHAYTKAIYINVFLDGILETYVHF